MMRFLILFAGVLIFLSSCVPVKKIMLLQKGDINKKDLPKDSVLRTYALNSFDYKIQSQDIISVTFESLTSKEYDFFSKENQGIGTNLTTGNALLMGEIVDEAGNIPFPVVGKVHVAGLNIFEIQEKLQEVADQYLDFPLVKVRLLNYRITLLGEVNREGTISLQNNRITMIEAIASGGGLGELADRSNIKLIRQKQGVSEVVYINLLEEDFMTSPYYYVNQNDILIVPPLKQRSFRRYFGPNISVIVSSISLLLLVLNLSQN